MPIKGFDLAPEHASQGLPRIGTLHKGSPKRKRTKQQNGKTVEYEIFGEDLHHFRVTFEPEYENERPVFESLYGKEPNRLLVMVNGDTVNDAVDAWKEEYGPSGTAQDKGAVILQKRCDGETQHLWYNQRSGFYDKSRISCESKVCGCKPTGRLNLILPEFSEQTGILGYFTIQTTSERDIRTMYARLISAQVLFGGLRGVQLLLYREEQKLNVPQVSASGQRTGKKSTVKKHMLELRVMPEFVKRHLLPALNSHRELPAQVQDSSSGIPSLEQSKSTLGTGGSRRVGNGNGSGHSNGNGTAQKSLPAIITAEPAEDFGADLTIEENAQRWQDGWEPKGVYRPDLLAALGMPGITLWNLGSVKADAKVNAYLVEMGAAEAEAQPELEKG